MTFAEFGLRGYLLAVACVLIKLNLLSPKFKGLIGNHLSIHLIVLGSFNLSISLCIVAFISYK